MKNISYFYNIFDHTTKHTKSTKIVYTCFETFEKCSILFKFKSKIPDYERVKAKILTTPNDLPDLRGRHEYIKYFED